MQVSIYLFLLNIFMHRLSSQWVTKKFNGKQPELGQFPFAVAVLMSDSKTIRCTGALVTTKDVLTAAHCSVPIGRQKTIFCMAGEISLDRRRYTRQIRKVKHIILHPKAQESYNRTKASHPNFDFALLTVGKAFELSKAVDVIPISQAELKDKSKCISLGFARAETPNTGVIEALRFGQHRIDRRRCKGDVMLKNPSMYCVVSPNQVIRYRDSGGPLISSDPPYILHGTAYDGDPSCAHCAVYSNIMETWPWGNVMIPKVRSSAEKMGRGLSLILPLLSVQMRRYK